VINDRPKLEIVKFINRNMRLLQDIKAAYTNEEKPDLNIVRDIASGLKL
jgi:hypothetical protein